MFVAKDKGTVRSRNNKFLPYDIRVLEDSSKHSTSINVDKDNTVLLQRYKRNKKKKCYSHKKT